MCRLVGYLGRESIYLEHLVSKTTHSLTVQSYQPQEMTAGLLNADGFGIGWYAPAQPPFFYKNTLPIWNDINLLHLGRYIKSNCILANIRSATPGQSLDLANCQPFSHRDVIGVHNGYIEDFHRSLYRPLRSLLKDEYYQNISGNTDSEHILALFFQNLIHNSGSMVLALQETLAAVIDLCHKYSVNASLNLIVSDGKQLVASRCASRTPIPSLYWLRSVDSMLIASEPLFEHSDWISLAGNTILAIAPDFSPSFIDL
ncbi:TIGR03442 family protein [Synechococcus sp. PCC 7502]|uniref:ergothioneine biosynthesis protein EgtC n=1 Tax=Synechococcus sp. PCC 7502 TaxID=1173263 RepID=UPI00029F92B4|nr:ergothioneine biosynthesis protein EgtC [Synechococcus sp. PCC 7502]AFY72211.1 TIGR03442 family protein [Synechococcus sp. PCC 7502]